jgi:hypothetical protein
MFRLGLRLRDVATRAIRAIGGEQRPPLLFRYRTFSADRDLDPKSPGYLASLILDRVIFVPAIASFNDPWDSCPGFTVSAGQSDPAMALTKFLLHRHSPGESPWDSPYAEEVRRDIERFGLDVVLARCHEQMSREMRMRCVLCLSSRGDVPLQWSYYAGGHSGFVLAFDGTAMPFLGARPVRYRKEFPTIVVDRAYVPGHALDETLLSKAESWQHELEWRLIAVNGYPGLDRLEPQPRFDVEGVYAKIPAGALKAIVVGARMSPTHKHQVRRLAESVDPPIRVVEARQARYRFEIHLPKL